MLAFGSAWIAMVKNSPAKAARRWRICFIYFKLWGNYISHADVDCNVLESFIYEIPLAATAFQLAAIRTEP